MVTRIENNCSSLLVRGEAVEVAVWKTLGKTMEMALGKEMGRRGPAGRMIFITCFANDFSKYFATVMKLLQ